MGGSDGRGTGKNEGKKMITSKKGMGDNHLMTGREGKPFNWRKVAILVGELKGFRQESGQIIIFRPINDLEGIVA
jgi:hypothetical protein